MAAVHREVVRQCRVRGLPVPSLGSVTRRAAKLDPAATTAARHGRDAVRPLQSAGGVAPPVNGLLEQVQMDHTPVDVIVVDERHRLPIGRPYLTAAIDVLSRCIVGMVVTLEAPSALSVGLCLAHMVTDKRWWRRGRSRVLNRTVDEAASRSCPDRTGSRGRTGIVKRGCGTTCGTESGPISQNQAILGGLFHFQGCGTRLRSTRT